MCNKLENILTEREDLYELLKIKLNNLKSEDLKYYDNLMDLEGIIDDLKELRERELDLLGKKVA